MRERCPTPCTLKKIHKWVCYALSKLKHELPEIGGLRIHVALQKSLVWVSLRFYDLMLGIVTEHSRCKLIIATCNMRKWFAACRIQRWDPFTDKGKRKLGCGGGAVPIEIYRQILEEIKRRKIRNSKKKIDKYDSIFVTPPSKTFISTGGGAEDNNSYFNRSLGQSESWSG